MAHQHVFWAGKYCDLETYLIVSMPDFISNRHATAQFVSVPICGTDSYQVTLYVALTFWAEHYATAPPPIYLVVTWL